MAYLSNSSSNFEKISDKFKNNINFLLEAVRANAMLISKVDKMKTGSFIRKLRKYLEDKEVLMDCVEKNGIILEYAPMKHRSD